MSALPVGPSLMQAAAAYQRIVDTHEEPTMVMEESPTYMVTLHIGEITGLRPVYPFSDMCLTATFANDVLFESEHMQMSETLTIDHDVTLPLNIDDLAMVSKFISSPITFSLVELLSPVPPPSEKIPQRGNVGQVLWRSEESVLDLEEALFGQKSVIHDKIESRKSFSKKSKSKSSRSSQGSTKKGKKRKSKVDVKNWKEFEPPQPTGPQVAGSATIDLVPLFLDRTEIVESLVLKAPAGQPLDDRVRPASKLPKIAVEITLDRALPSGNIFYYTLESVYNLPKVMSRSMDYQIMVGIPMNFKDRLVPFNAYTYAESPREAFTFKRYYGSETLSNFALRDDFDNVKFALPGMDMADALQYDAPRLEYNIVKGEYALDEDIDALRSKISTYRCVGLELYMTNPAVMSATNKSALKTHSSKGSKKSMSKKGSKAGSKKSKKGKDSVKSEKVEEEYLHLMAFVNVCRLLCPGEQSTRVACELRTFNYQEFEETCGLGDSFFRPKPVPPPPPVPPHEYKPHKAKEKKGSKKDKKSSKKSKSSKSKSKSSKGSKAGKKSAKGHGDLRLKLPAHPVPHIPSEPVYNEQGFPTFIIVEFEFRAPITPTKEVADLHSDLADILREKPLKAEEPREFKSKYVTRDVFQNTIKTVALNVKLQYLEYLKRSGQKENLQDFLDFIQNEAVYETYMASLTKSAAIYCNVAKKYDPKWTSDEYHAFIGESYVDLVEMLNCTLAVLGKAGNDVEVGRGQGDDATDDSLFYAKEATALGATGLAKRYYLQRIATNPIKASYWLDYAIYHLQMDEPEAAQECAMEALQHDQANRDCLLMFACLIARKGKVAEAETCLLNVTLSNPKWVQGWNALYCIYHRSRNVEGMELCQDMAHKYAEVLDTTTSLNDLHWTSKDLPNKFHYRAAAYLIHLRLYDEAELVIADESFRRQTDTTEYLLAVIDCCKGQYQHALDHINVSFTLGSCSYQKNALRGHIYAHLDQPDCAIEEFEKIIKDGTSGVPFDACLYMVYVRAGLCYSALGREDDARKVLLAASEKLGSPYAWLATGVLYYHQQDYRSAEDCLTISNTLDHVMPETWAYLTLVNIRLERPNEASNCYHQAVDHQLQNEELLRFIDDELKHWEQEFLNHNQAKTS